MSCKFEYKGKEYNSENELLSVLSTDPDILKKYSPKNFYRGEAYTKEDIEQFDAKAEQLQKAMNVQIVFDENIDNAHVLGKNDPKTKKAGKPVIMVNPNSLFRETAIHEFGHVFVDSLPNGIENTRIKKAYEQLKGTQLEAEVRELYPDLNEEMFIKELITTAIGREGADIWDNQDDVTRWQVFKDWFLGYLNRTFGIPRDEIKAMANEILSGKEIKGDLTIGLSEKIQELATPTGQQEGKPKQSNTTQKITEIEQTYRGLLARINSAVTEYSPSDTKAWKSEKTAQQLGPTMYSRVKDAEKELLELYNTDQKLGLYKYVEWVEKELTSLEKTIEQSKNGVSMKNNQLVKIARWDYAFETVDDIQSLMVSMERDGEISPEDAKDISDKMRDVQGRRAAANKEILNIQRKRYVSFISANDNSVEQEYIDGYIKEYNDLKLEESGKTLEEHIYENLQNDKYEIRSETKSRIEVRALELDYDLDTMAANFYSEKNANSKDIQILSKVVDGVDTTIKKFSESEAGVFDAEHKKFLEDVSKSNNMEKKYENMYTVSENGDHYFTSRYKPDFIEAHNKLKGDIYKAQDGQMYQDIELTKSKDGKLYYKIEGAKNAKGLYLGPKDKVKIEHEDGSMHVTVTKDGATETMTVAEAIATSELAKWEFENTEKNQKGARVIKDKWKNEAYDKLSSAQLTHLQFLKKKARQADGLTGNNSRLRKNEYGAEFIKLPTMTKTFTQRVTSGEITGGFRDMLTDIGRVKADESFEYESAEGVNVKERRFQVVTDISNTIQQGVPVKFRGKLKDSNEQSIDLHTITLANLAAAKEHKEKKEMEKTFLIILDVMKNRKVKDVSGSNNTSKLHKNVKIKNANGDIIQPNVYKNRNDGEYRDVLKAMDILERRIYGIKSKYAGEIGGKDVNKLTNTWLRYSGMTSLVGNFPNSIVNYTAGSIQIYIEALGGEHFGVKDYLSARKTYWADMRNILNDMGNNVDTSRTNLFMNFLNVTGENKVLQSNFENQNKVKSSFNMSNLRPMAKAGEHMMHAQTMYAVMKGIKVMGPQGKFIDKNGKIVKDKKKAASLDEMIQFKRNEKTGEISMTLSPFVQSTTFTRTGTQADILVETRNLIKNKIIDLQGNYDPEIAAAAQKHFWGKLLFFLRKWMIPAYQRRWKGYSEMNKEFGEANQFYSQDLKGHKEGYYVTAVRFFKNILLPAIKKMEWQLVIKGKESMSAMEIANVRKALSELSFIALTWTSYTLLDLQAEGEDEDETLWTRYILRRQLSELSSILNPMEAYKIAKTPTASIGMANRIFQVISQSVSPYEEYQQGPKKGRNKLWVKTLKATPIFSQLEKDIEDSLSFLEGMSF
jgi:hypothetical protein